MRRRPSLSLSLSLPWIAGSLLTAGAIHAFASDSEAQITLGDLREAARSAIADGDVTACAPSIAIFDGNLSYAIPEVHFFPAFDDEDPIYMPLQDMLMVEKIRSALKRFPGGPGLNPEFWNPLLDRAEGEVRKQLADIRSMKRGDPALTRRLESRSRLIFRIYEDATRDYARKRGLAFMEVAPAPAAGIVKTNPSGGDLQMMHVLEWFICQKRGYDPEAVMPHIQSGRGKQMFNGTYIWKLSYDGKTVVRPRTVRMQAGTTVFRSDGQVVPLTGNLPEN